MSRCKWAPSGGPRMEAGNTIKCSANGRASRLQIMTGLEIEPELGLDSEEISAIGRRCGSNAAPPAFFSKPQKICRWDLQRVQRRSHVGHPELATRDRKFARRKSFRAVHDKDRFRSLKLRSQADAPQVSVVSANDTTDQEERWLRSFGGTCDISGAINKGRDCRQAEGCEKRHGRRAAQGRQSACNARS
jgi:hypothetical protein